MEKKIQKYIIENVTRYALTESDVVITIHSSNVTGHTIETNSYSSGEIVFTHIKIKNDKINIRINSYKLSPVELADQVIYKLNSDINVDNISTSLSGEMKEHLYFQYTDIIESERIVTEKEVREGISNLLSTLELTKTKFLESKFHGVVEFKTQGNYIVMYYNGINMGSVGVDTDLVERVKNRYDKISICYWNEHEITVYDRGETTTINLNDFNVQGKIDYAKLVEYLKANSSLLYQLKNKRILNSILEGCKDYLFGIN